uniref:Zinc finger matrin-type protein 5 n=1 Tax=Nothoprocta perdicaria TaxID=30464 RepID=A0A8C6YS68_NOTPE
MGKRYFCDYCDRSFQDNLHNRKKHLNGVQHLRAKRAWYDLFRDAAAILQEEQSKKPCRKFLQTGQCDFGPNCRFSHMTEQDLEKLSAQVVEQRGEITSFDLLAMLCLVQLSSRADFLPVHLAKTEYCLPIAWQEQPVESVFACVCTRGEFEGRCSVIPSRPLTGLGREEARLKEEGGEDATELSRPSQLLNWCANPQGNSMIVGQSWSIKTV